MIIPFNKTLLAGKELGYMQDTVVMGNNFGNHWYTKRYQRSFGKII